MSLTLFSYRQHFLSSAPFLTFIKNCFLYQQIAFFSLYAFIKSIENTDSQQITAHDPCAFSLFLSIKNNTTAL